MLAFNYLTNCAASFILCFPCGSGGKESACNAEDPGMILGREDPLEKEMATHSSILAWEISWTQEPGGLQSMGLQRVGHNLVTSLFHSLYDVVCLV